MTTNTSFEDFDNFAWSLFNSPFAHSIYKWSAITIFLSFLQLQIVPLFIVVIYLSQTISLLIHDLQYKFNKTNIKNKTKVEKDRLLACGNFISWLWHGHEIVGYENLPDGPAIIYLYHGPYAIDAFHAHNRLQSARKERPISIIMNKLYKRNIVFGRAFETLNYGVPSREEVYARLKEGWQFILSIGAAEECKLSDNNYRVYRPERYGICHVLKKFKDARMPVVPMFTRNIQEAFWMPWFIKPLIKILPKQYWRFLCFTGGIPVKLTTFIGKEIDYDVSMSVEEILDRLCSGMQAHIDQHQIIPGNRMRALKERFCGKQSKKKM